MLNSLPRRVGENINAKNRNLPSRLCACTGSDGVDVEITCPRHGDGQNAHSKCLES
jgi:hypothetical protein